MIQNICSMLKSSKHNILAQKNRTESDNDDLLTLYYHHHYHIVGRLLLTSCQQVYSGKIAIYEKQIITANKKHGFCQQLIDCLGSKPEPTLPISTDQTRMLKPRAKCSILFYAMVWLLSTITASSPTCHCDRLINRQHQLPQLPSTGVNNHNHPSARSISIMITPATGSQPPTGHLPLPPPTVYQPLPILHMFHRPSSSHHLHGYHLGHRQHEECEINTDPVIELLLEKMRIHLPEEKITVQNGAITIFDARIVRFAELIRLRPSCARKLDPDGVQLLLPFEAEIRSANVAAKLKYNFYVTDLYGDYAANFSYIRLNGTFETNLEEEWMQVSEFNITSSQVLDDSIQFGYVPRWILELVRSYFDNDNTQMYEQLAKVMLQKEADNFAHYDLIRHISEQSSMLVEPREEEDQGVPPLNQL